MGRHSFRFSLKLPDALAPSFDLHHGRYGIITYRVQVTISRPWKWPKICIKPFTIVRTPSLPLTASTLVTFSVIERLRWLKRYLQVPLEERQTKRPGYFHNGTVTGRLYLLRDRYVPGEGIIVNADIHNNTGKSIKSSKIRLVQVY